MAQKGESAIAETAVARQAIRVLGGRHIETVELKLPDRQESHFLVLLEKQNTTSGKFPRRAGMPAKRPL